MSEDFSEGKRGSVVPSDPNKVRITIRLDADIINHFKAQVNNAGGGNYQTLINDALREHIQAHNKSLEVMLRKIIRDELKLIKVA
ncbi:MAG: antitoxin, BrnT family [Methyloprofundus sp.]|nr:MAG: antitoxin, BrnT family [Methyloprofundus sp.]